MKSMSWVFTLLLIVLMSMISIPAVAADPVVLDDDLKEIEARFNAELEKMRNQFREELQRAQDGPRNELIRAQNPLNFAYTLFLILRHDPDFKGKLSAGEIERLVRRWYAMSVLTGRYTSSPESRFEPCFAK